MEGGRGEVDLGKPQREEEQQGPSQNSSPTPIPAGYSSEVCDFLKPVRAFLGFGAAQTSLEAVRQTPPPSPGEV